MSIRAITVQYRCMDESFRPIASDRIRWLDRPDDSLLLPAVYGEAAPTPDEWAEWREQGYRFAARMDGGTIVSYAGRLEYSDEAWELVAVHTLPEHRRQGFAKAVCSFVTERILADGRLATCTTRETNLPMRAVLTALGYQEIGRRMMEVEEAV